MGYVRDDLGDEGYFEPTSRKSEGFDAGLLREPLSVIPAQKALVFKPDATVTEAMRAMQRDHRGCVLVTDDGTHDSKLLGIFTERDVLFRIVDKGRNPAALPIGEVMTPNPENLSDRSTVAYVLNKMSVGGFRHVPVVDDEHRPVCVISVRDVVSFLVQAFPREVLNLTTEPGPSAPRAPEGA
jgi:CBS domain-containing protein